MAQKLNIEAARQLGLRIREARRNKGLTLQNLGSITNIHHSQLSRIEQGRAVLVSKNIKLICTFLQISTLPDMPESQEILISRVKRLISTSPSNERALARVLDAMEELIKSPNC